MKMFKSFKILFLLFRITFSISAFTFGGGYIIAIPMMRKSFVEKLELLSEKELMDMSAIAQSTPGAIAVIIAVLVGYRIAGIKGAVISRPSSLSDHLTALCLLSGFS